MQLTWTQEGSGLNKLTSHQFTHLLCSLFLKYIAFLISNKSKIDH